jgi:alpha-glucosidase
VNNRCQAPVIQWGNAVVYQIYPRSFQDTDGDGIGDIKGIVRRLDDLHALGVDALWLSPMYPSPLADGGYDVADFTGVDRRLGSLDDMAELIAEAHRWGIAVLLDLVPNHTSIEHPWFREHPGWYIWADAQQNNWRAAFGGSVWTCDGRSGRWYLHSFYPEQPDLDWRNPEVVGAMQDVVRTWLGRGVDGFRLDALDCLGKHPDLLDDPPATAPPPFPEPEEVAALERRHSRNWIPAVRPALAALRVAAGDAFLVGEVYRPTLELGPYLESLTCAFVFELLFSDWRADALGRVLERAGAMGGTAWMLSNHDFGRVGSRIGEANLRAAAMLLHTLPGPVFLYQGDEIGLLDGPGADPPLDRYNRDGARHPMQWDAGPQGGFTTATPWLPAVDPARRNVADQRADPGSLWSLHRDLIALRRQLGGGLQLVAAEVDGRLAYRRGDVLVTLNLGAGTLPLPDGEVVLRTHSGPQLGPGEGAVVRNPG